MAVGLAYVGFQETRLRFHCPEPLKLTVTQLGKEKSEGPIWVQFETVPAPAEAGIVTSQSGTKRGVFIPVTDPNDETMAIAVLQAKDLKAAAKMKGSREAIKIQGLAYYPSAGTSKILGTYLRQVGLRGSPHLRVVEVGRTPSRLIGSFALLLVGSALALWAAIGLVRNGGQSRQSSRKTNSLLGVHKFAELQNPPLPEEVRVEVRHMLDDAWSRVQSQ
jgi:hypothetical protein